MFTLPPPPLRHAARLSRIRQLSPPGNRQFTSAIQDGFLDLSLAIPWPPSFPPYSSTIILLTFASRLLFTVPFSLWAKRRQWRAEDLVIPALQETRPLVQKQILHEMHVEQSRGTKEELRIMFSDRVKKAMIVRRNELFAKYRCRPWLTMLIPPLTQLPLFVGSSMFLSRLSQSPTVYDSESFLTLTSLAHADPTATLPIALGMITLANVESSRWFISEAAKERDELEQKRLAEKRAQGHIVLEPRKIVQTGLRVLSIGRILISAVVPGSVLLYWVSSATFGLLQSWVFDYWERRRLIPRGLAASQRSTPPPDTALTGGKVALASASTLRPRRK
ncbi:60Kd inner membrane protein-domain-containing protein [Multifurca ochricompacta]|uniref:60Kd inner membrane protein-domain-containing protein n=1 Tax=Multifurca ochricompacta TaxID=376703 RepID=A0AAD4MBU3_9AGAM|nr:60Kd inner membrane protein-domain-containing protein [Multifurca ochricompacta]